MMYFTYGCAVTWHGKYHEVVKFVSGLALRLKCVVVQSSQPKNLVFLVFSIHSITFELAICNISSRIRQVLRFNQIRYLVTLLRPFKVSLNAKHTAFFFKQSSEEWFLSYFFNTAIQYYVC